MNRVKYGKEYVDVSKVVCIGRNYVEHIEELGNEIPAEMVVFNKPKTAKEVLLDPVVLLILKYKVPTTSSPASQELHPLSTSKNAPTSSRSLEVQSPEVTSQLGSSNGLGISYASGGC